MGKTDTREERKRKKRGKEKTEVPRNAARAAALWARDFNPMSCPVFDLEKNVLFEGYWQSMSRRGGITLTPQLGGMGYRPVCKNDVGVGEKEESATPEEGSCVVLERLV
uniref:Uncharacterized protein n=1 Tax=Timema shepardi TaxID=629360 RepID=A0A7R9ARV2_TIMSH|nr:unnamed protein product [Timema shepardi]